MTETAHGPEERSSSGRNRVALPGDAEELLDAVLAHRGWERREGQVLMVRAISDAAETARFREALDRRVVSDEDESSHGGVLDVDVAVNAPVGTGKTLAYVLAALARGERIVVSTSTKSLQDQIVGEELPQLKRDLKAIYDYDLDYAVLKGRGNYPCNLSVGKLLTGKSTEEDDDLFGEITVAPDSSDIAILREIAERSEAAQASGDVLSMDSEHLIGRLTRTTQMQVRASKRCAAKSAPWDSASDADTPATLDDLTTYWSERNKVKEAVALESPCAYRAAYAQCMSAQVVVVNTTLLVFEVKKALTKFSETQPTLLNGVGMVVVDESHHLPRILAEAYSFEARFASILSLVDDVAKKVTRRYGAESVTRFLGLRGEIAQAQEAAWKAIDDTGLSETDLRERLSTILSGAAIRTRHAIDSLSEVGRRREEAEPSGLKLSRDGVPKVVASLGASLHEEVVRVLTEASGMVKRTNSTKEFTNELTYTEEKDGSLSLKIVPLDVSFFRSQLSGVTREPSAYVGPPSPAPRSTAVLSSGTITVETARTVGMRSVEFVDVPSPFDSRKARLYVPDLPEPSSREWLEESFAAVEEAVRTVGGRTMILTTSRAKLEEFTNLARRRLPYPVLSQMDGRSKIELVRDFKESVESVLVGTVSFWEGVDVPGESLSLVVMDKIPFPSPKDPIFSGRRKWVESHGGNAFNQVDCDYAAVMVAQGAGRLIRSTGDVGGVMILDPRVSTKRYGGSITKLLPADWPVTRDRELFLDWLRWVNPETRRGELPEADPELWRLVRAPRDRRKLS